jgi:hypothetical protein
MMARLWRAHVGVLVQQVLTTEATYDNPNAAGDDVHGYESDGTPIRDPLTGDKHFSTIGE